MSPLPSLVLALRIGTSTGGGGGATSVAVTMLSTTATAAAAAAATEAPELPLKGLLVLNSRHFAPKTIIILETAILGFLAAMRGLGEKAAGTKKRKSLKIKEVGEVRRDYRSALHLLPPRPSCLPDKLAEGLVVGEGAIILLREHMVNVFHAPVFQELSRGFRLLQREQSQSLTPSAHPP